MKRIVIAVLSLFVISVMLYTAYTEGTKTQNKKNPALPVSVSPTSTPVTVTPVAKSTAEQIEAILADKYKRPVTEVKVTITNENASFAGGSVLFGQGGPGEGGMFLARKVNDKWEVVFDGNGNVDCTKMRQDFGFPDEILKPNFCE